MDEDIVLAAFVGLALMNRVNVETSNISKSVEGALTGVSSSAQDIIGDFQALTGLGVTRYVNVAPETWTQPSKGSQWYQINMTPEQLTERWTVPDDYQGIQNYLGVPVQNVFQKDNYLYAVL